MRDRFVFSCRLGAYLIFFCVFNCLVIFIGSVCAAQTDLSEITAIMKDSESVGQTPSTTPHDEMSDNNIPRGSKMVHMANGGMYRGSLLHGEPNGQGVFCYVNGDMYEGAWKQGLRHGKGKYSWKNGKYYVGNFEKDFPVGSGTYYLINGDRKEIQWHEGQLQGSSRSVYTGKVGRVTWKATDSK